MSYLLPSDADLLTTAEAAREVGVAQATVRRWVRSGTFPPRPNGEPGAIRMPLGRLRFHADAVAALKAK